MYLQYIRPPYLALFAKCLEGFVHHQRLHICRCSVLTTIDHGKFISCVVPDPSQQFFHFGEYIVIAWIQEKTTTLGGKEPHHSSCQCKESHRCVTDLLRRWKWEILEHPPYSPDMSPCDNDLSAKVKEPMRRTRYKRRGELIRDIERSIRNMNNDGRTDGVLHLPNIWEKVTTILKVHKCCTPVNKAMSEISNCCHYFLSNPCSYKQAIDINLSCIIVRVHRCGSGSSMLACHAAGPGSIPVRDRFPG